MRRATRILNRRRSVKPLIARACRHRAGQLCTGLIAAAIRTRPYPSVSGTLASVEWVLKANATRGHEAVSCVLERFMAVLSERLQWGKSLRCASKGPLAQRSTNTRLANPTGVHRCMHGTHWGNRDRRGRARRSNAHAARQAAAAALLRSPPTRRRIHCSRCARAERLQRSFRRIRACVRTRPSVPRDVRLDGARADY